MGTSAGWFGPDSVVWRLHADPCMLAGGMRALLIQALEPRAMALLELNAVSKHFGAIQALADVSLALEAGDRIRAAARDRGYSEREVLTVEFKINFLSPARGSRFIATGRVIRTGRAVTVCTGEAIALDGDRRATIALMQATMFAVPASPTT